MNTLDSMLERNKNFAAQQSAAAQLCPLFRGDADGKSNHHRLR